MIKETITYGRQNILTVYHRGFDEETKKRRLKINEKIGRYRIIFEETYIPDENFKIPDDYVWKNEFLLKPDDTINPYHGGTCCAKMLEYFYAQKPKYMFRYNNKDNQYDFAIELNDILKINEFTKKYTGMDLKKYPLGYGNIFIFEPHLIDIKRTKDKQIYIKNLRSSMLVTIHFKEYENIICTNIAMKPSIDGELYVTPNKKNWNAYDIFIYENDELFYEQKNIYYIEEIQFSMNIMKKSNPIYLSELKNTFSIDYLLSKEKFSVGNKNINDFKSLWKSINLNLYNKLSSHVKKSSILFIKPNEINKVIAKVKDTLISANYEVWIFDSYFTDKRNILITIDWLRIIIECLVYAKICHIVFYFNDENRSYSAVKLKEYLIKYNPNNILGQLRNRNAVLIFHQTKNSKIHDRFIIKCNKENKCLGIGIGTSFNSAHKNFFCIYDLDNRAKNICYELQKWLNEGNLQDKTILGEIS
ncbi:MAG: hypothetical protein IJ563_11670 [Selenomonadaceae bacterium]|nr:hypothetical protein [Selenomonadaceae bacterium]